MDGYVALPSGNRYPSAHSRVTYPPLGTCLPSIGWSSMSYILKVRYGESGGAAQPVAVQNEKHTMMAIHNIIVQAEGGLRELTQLYTNRPLGSGHQYRLGWRQR